MKTLLLTVSSFTSTSLSHCFSLLSAFLYSKPFRNNKMHCEIIDRYFNIFFVEIQLENGNLKSVLWVLEFGHPNQYTSLPNGLNTSLYEDLKPNLSANLNMKISFVNLKMVSKKFFSMCPGPGTRRISPK